MKNPHINHPAILLHDVVDNICSPLKRLNITYFSHIFVDNQKQFSAIATNPQYATHYLKNQYYKRRDEFYPDSLFKQNLKNNFVIWDIVKFKGISAKIYQEAASYGIKHLFSIVEDELKGRHYYNFANDGDDLSINQIYLANLDLLHKFVKYFKAKIQESKELRICHDIKFQIEPTQEEVINLTGILDDKKKHDFLNNIDSSHKEYNKMLLNSALILKNKNIDKAVKLTAQQTKCMHLLATGHTNKQIASTLNLSTRTVENYIDKIRTLLGCTTSKELIVLYYNSQCESW